MPAIKAFVKARDQIVSANKQELVAGAIECPYTHFFRELATVWYGGGGRGRLYTYRYPVTTRMNSALRWAAMRAILMFQ